MHILLIHQAFAALDEPGGTRHHEMAIHLAKKGHRVTIIASPLSYLTGDSEGNGMRWVEEQSGGEGITILRAFTYQALHRSFVHRVISFLSFMFSSFWIGLSIKQVDIVWGTSPPTANTREPRVRSRPRTSKHRPQCFNTRTAAI